MLSPKNEANQAGDWEEKGEYSCVYCYIKRPPKMQRLSGRLQESNHRGSLPRRGPSTSTLGTGQKV